MSIMTSPASTSKAARLASAQCYAASIAILFGLGLPGSAYAGPLATPGPERGAAPALVYSQAPGDDFAPPSGPGYGPAPAPAYAPSPGPGYAAAPPPAGVVPAQGRGISRAAFIERRRQAAARNGRDPERAAARAAQMFEAADVNHDGFVDPAERAAFMRAHPELARGQPH
jgi:hypothetical protein